MSLLHSFCDGSTSKVALKVVQRGYTEHNNILLWAGRSNQEEVWWTNSQKATTHLKGSFLNLSTLSQNEIAPQDKIVST
jgi:hypothetical protein